MASNPRTVHRDEERPYVATFDDGSQLLVIGTTVARRANRWQVWGPPVELEEAP